VAARDKLFLATKEKQLQMQRKRKAALFASLLKHSSNVGTALEAVSGGYIHSIVLLLPLVSWPVPRQVQSLNAFS